MEMKDEHLQSEIEKSGEAGDSLDAHAYKRVFDALRKEPDFSLPANFADRVVQAVSATKESSRDTLWLVLGITLFIAAATIAIVLTGFRPDVGVFRFLAGYPGLIVFGLAFILSLQWVDRRLVRHRQSL